MKVSICLATYNGEKYLIELLNSIERQEYDDMEVVVRDDGSNDSTLDILRGFQKRSKYKVRIVDDNDGNVGVRRNFIRVLEKAIGDLIFFADQDDIWLPQKVRVMVDKYMQNVSTENIPMALYSDFSLITDKGEVQVLTSPKEEIKNMRYENFIPGCTLAINKVLQKMYIIRNPQSWPGLHDWGVLLLNYYCGGRFIFVDQMLIRYRQHENNCVGYLSDKEYFYKKGKFSHFIDSSKKSYELNQLISEKKCENFAFYLFKRVLMKYGV